MVFFPQDTVHGRGPGHGGGFVEKLWLLWEPAAVKYSRVCRAVYSLGQWAHSDAPNLPSSLRRPLSESVYRLTRLMIHPVTPHKQPPGQTCCRRLQSLMARWVAVPGLAQEHGCPHACLCIHLEPARTGPCTVPGASSSESLQHGSSGLLSAPPHSQPGRCRAGGVLPGQCPGPTGSIHFTQQATC